MCRSIWSSNIGNARICMENRGSQQTKRVTYFCKTCPKACKAKCFAIQTSTFLLWWFPLPLCRTINQSAYERNIPVGLLLLGDLHTYPLICWRNRGPCLHQKFFLTGCWWHTVMRPLPQRRPCLKRQLRVKPPMLWGYHWLFKKVEWFTDLQNA